MKHLTIFDADVAEFVEERGLNLYGGSNNVEWRSLAPQAFLGTLRVTADRATFSHQSITLDGPEVRGQKTPVLRLVVQNAGADGPRQATVNYLAPRLSWNADYSLMLGPATKNGVPEEMSLDGWVSIKNDTGTDICADAVDLIAGEVHLLSMGNVSVRDFAANSQTLSGVSAGMVEAPGSPGALVSPLGALSRIALGRNISLPANSFMDRFPLLQWLKVPVEQRNVFENDGGMETLGRSGFTSLPRSLDVRLVSRNGSSSVLPAGTVTIYSGEGDGPQVVGQDRIPLTPKGSDFTVSQGRSNTLQGTRRILERVQTTDSEHRPKLVTKVEVVINNSGSHPATAFVREGVEKFGNGDWAVTESSNLSQKLSDRTMEFKLLVPPADHITLQYTIETH